MATKKGRDYPLSPTPPPQSTDSTKNGEYYAYSSGMVGRTKRVGDKSLTEGGKQEHMSMDTTGYAAPGVGGTWETNEPASNQSTKMVERQTGSFEKASTANT